jgi:hypothetical protein
MPTTAATIHTDSAGNKYIGDCVFHNSNIYYPLNYHLQSLQFSASGDANNANDYPFAASIEALFASLGIESFQYTLAGTWGGSNLRFDVELPGYTAINPDTRAQIGYNVGINITGGNITGPSLYLSKSLDDLRTNDTNNLSNVVISASNNHIAYLGFRYNFSSAGYYSFFRYACLIQDINTTYNYYNANLAGRVALMGYDSTSTYNNSFSTPTINHRINNSTSSVLTTGDAAYPIVCANAATPVDPWATDFYIFHNHATLGYPCIGRLPGLLLATGTFPLFKLVKIPSIAAIDNGSQWYIPIATFTGKTVLMRCYSSQT